MASIPVGIFFVGDFFSVCVISGTGSRGPGDVENAGPGGKRGVPFFSPKYEFSSVK